MEEFHADTIWELVAVGCLERDMDIGCLFESDSSVAEPLGVELQSFHSSGETVLVTGIENLSILATDKSYAAPWIPALKFAAGRIVSYEEYIDSAPVAAAFA